MKIDIKKIGINGEGIGYDNKMPVFVDRALTNEIVDATIIENNKRYKVAKLNKVIIKSKDRVKPLCENYNYCSGCSLMHTTYNNQLEIKKDLLKEALLKYADIELLEDIEIVASPLEINYRNCLKLPFVYHQDKLALGIFKKDSNVPKYFDKCLIHSKLLEELKDKVLEILNSYDLKIYDKKSKSGLRYLVLREIGNRAHMCLITGNDVIDQNIVNELNNIKEIVSIYQCINTSRDSIDIFSNRMIHLAGGKHLAFKIDNLKFNLSVRSFYQLNTLQAKNLYRYVNSLIDDNNDLIVEAYCGIGAMSLLSHNKSKKVEGIEYIKDATVNANVNANINHIDNVEFFTGDAGKLLLNEYKNKEIDVLIVDPPRSGLDDNMLKAIKSTKIKKIIYVSCNPATLAKNLNELLDDYDINSIKAFDMFPNTSHVECVIEMKSNKKSKTS